MVWYLFWYLEDRIRKRDYKSLPEDKLRSSALRCKAVINNNMRLSAWCPWPTDLVFEKIRIVMVPKRRIEFLDYDPNWVGRVGREAENLHNVFGTALDVRWAPL
jgi:hypothetical protein